MSRRDRERTDAKQGQDRVDLRAGDGCARRAGAPAQADHHFVLIREYFPGTVTNARDDAFIELQMWTAGQNLMQGHHIDTYGPGADMTPSTNTFGTTPIPNSDNQRTILAGGDLVTNRDLPEDLGNAAGLDPAGGAVCFRSQTLGLIDCVEWGSGNNTINAGTPVASPGGIPDGQSITRSIAPGCASLLEFSDDSNDSTTDFALTSPTPRPNSVTPTEGPCSSPPPGGGSTIAPPPQPTGKRARALKKCKKKKTAAARKKCRKKAKLLPV